MLTVYHNSWKSADAFDTLNEKQRDLKSLDQTGSILLLQYKPEHGAPNLHDQES